jgi:hypothetical protein
MSLIPSENGQATIELVFSAVLIAITVLGSGWVLRAGWYRTQCAYLSFETAKSAVAGSENPSNPVSVQHSDDRVKTRALCGDQVQQFEAVKLHAKRSSRL